MKTNFNSPGPVYVFEWLVSKMRSVILWTIKTGECLFLFYAVEKIIVGKCAIGKFAA